MSPRLVPGAGILPNRRRANRKLPKKAVRLHPRSTAARERSPHAPALHFTGEVLREGQIYDRDIGHDLIFRLTPATSDDGGGWVIEILPHSSKRPTTAVEFRVAGDRHACPTMHTTSAYVSRRVRLFRQGSPRPSRCESFHFVQSLADEHIAEQEVVNVVAPSPLIAISDEIDAIDDQGAHLLVEAAGDLLILGTGISSAYRKGQSRNSSPGKGTNPTDHRTDLKFRRVVLHG